MSAHPEDDTTDPSEGWLTTGWVLALAIVLAVVMGTGYLLWIRFKPTPTPSVTTQPIPSVSIGNTPAPPPTTSTATGECGPARAAAGDRLGVAPETKWVAVAGRIVPTTPGGPAKTDGYPHCYTPDMTGAVTAAANLYVLSFGDSATARAVRAQGYLPPVGADIQGQQAKVVANVQILGFQAPNPITDGRVTVNLKFSAAGEGRLVEGGVPIPLRWDGQDWKVDGAAIAQVQQWTPVGVVSWEAR